MLGAQFERQLEEERASIRAECMEELRGEREQ